MQKSYSHLEFENPTFKIRSKSIWTKSFNSFVKKIFFWIFASFLSCQKHKDFWNLSKILFPLRVWKSRFLPYIKKSKSKICIFFLGKKFFFWIFASFSGCQKPQDFWNCSKILFPLRVWKSCCFIRSKFYKAKIRILVCSNVYGTIFS